jgi:hypothetical protein
MLNISIDGYNQISKATARKLYNDGATVYMCAANMRPGAPWYPEMSVDCRDGDFTRICNDFIWYNCTSETGTYIRFYVKESE